jgi:hypothetical protein
VVEKGKNCSASPRVTKKATTMAGVDIATKPFREKKARNAYKDLTESPEGKRPPRGLTAGRNIYSIIMDLKQRGRLLAELNA